MRHSQFESIFSPCTLRENRRNAVRRMALAIAITPVLPLCAQEQMKLATAINRTARFRALSQRVAKAYGQLYLQVLPPLTRDVMEQARQQIQESLSLLERQPWPAHVMGAISEVRISAAKLDLMASQPPTKDGFLSVSSASEQLLTRADLATKSLEDMARSPTAKLVNLAGRQRMLSQRVAKNYALIAAGWDTPAVRTQMSEDLKAFRKANQDLASAPLSTAAIRETLELAEGQWVFFEAATKRLPDPRSLDNVATTSERILALMDDLTNLYEAALLAVTG